jgi:hypothetical protein
MIGFAHDHSKCRTANLSLSLWTAALYGDLHSVEHAVAHKGNNPSKADEYGFTALHHAATNGHVDVVRYLLAQRADVNAAGCGATALHRAAYHGHKEIATLLLDAGATVHAVDASTDYRTPLAKACAQGQLELVNLLLSHGATPLVADRQGRTCWQLATSFPTIQTLLLAQFPNCHQPLLPSSPSVPLAAPPALGAPDSSSCVESARITVAPHQEVAITTPAGLVTMPHDHDNAAVATPAVAIDDVSRSDIAIAIAINRSAAATANAV